MQIFLILLLLPNHISALALGNELFYHFYFRETLSGIIRGTILNEILVSEFFFLIDHHFVLFAL